MIKKLSLSVSSEKCSDYMCQRFNFECKFKLNDCIKIALKVKLIAVDRTLMLKYAITER